MSQQPPNNPYSPYPPPPNRPPAEPAEPSYRSHTRESRPVPVIVPARPTFFGTVVRMTSALLFTFILFLFGFYAGMFAAFGGFGGPEVYRDGEIGGSDAIAIIAFEGEIHPSTVEYARLSVDAVLADESIKAVVLRIDSPGGDAVAADQTLYELKRLKSQGNLPVIASYGGMAASGGYYISCQADKIFAEPTCVTGSIGVIANVPTLGDLLDKVGVRMETITASAAPGKETANTMYRNWTEEDRVQYRKIVDAVYEQFTAVVYEGRKHVMDESQVSALANGHAMTAREALERKLIDEIGYLDAALDAATEAGDFDSAYPKAVLYRPAVPSFTLFSLKQIAAQPSVEFNAEETEKLLRNLARPRLEMRLQP